MKISNSIIKNHKGTILFEALIALLICSLAVMIVSPILISLQKSVKNYNWLVQQEWIISTMQIEKEIEDAEHIIVTDKQLAIQKNNENETITYEKYGSLLRRRVNKMGHEVILMKIKTIVFQKSDHYILLRITKETGERFERMFPIS